MVKITVHRNKFQNCLIPGFQKLFRAIVRYTNFCDAWTRSIYGSGGVKIRDALTVLLSQQKAADGTRYIPNRHFFNELGRC